MNREKKELLRLTIICPVYNEEKIISLFFDRMLPVIKELSLRYQVDLLFMNNASTDGTYEAIEALRREHAFVYVITLSCNVGYHRSLDGGLRNAQGDILAFIDVDCEDPPEMILDFVKHYERGYDLVYGERKDREESRPIKMLRKLFYKIANRVADEDFILYMAEFSLFTAEVRDAMVQEHNSFPFVRSSIARVGFKRIGIPYKRHRRIGGETHFRLLGMTIIAVAGLLSSSTLPLRIPAYFLPFWLLLTAILGSVHIITGNPWFLFANILLAAIYFGWTVAFTALYVARTYKNGLGRPNFVVHRRYTHAQSH